MEGTPQGVVSGERELQLDKITASGVPLWRLIREQVADQHLGSQSGRNRANQNRVAAGRWLHVAAGVLRSLIHLARLARHEFLVIGYPRRHREAGEWIDPFSDPVIDVLGPERVLCLEKPYVGEHCRPPRTKRIVYLDWAIVLILLAATALFPIAWLVHRREIGELARRARRVVDLAPSRVALIAAKALTRYRIERIVAGFVLSIVRPRVVLLTLRRHHYAWITECHERGIAAYELQHGTVAEGGYKSRKMYSPVIDPDALLVFGEHWRTVDFGLPAETVEPIGFKYLEDRRRGWEWKPDRRGGEVMLVSQPHVSGILDRAFEAVVRELPDVRFLLKLHPQDVDRWWERYPCGRLPNVRVVADRGADLYGLFAGSRAVLGRDSTVLFEASYFGLPVGILNMDGGNGCAALKFAGRYNFHEIRDAREVASLLRAAPGTGTSVDNPFFASFDRAGFLRLMERGRASWPPAYEK